MAPSKAFPNAKPDPKVAAREAMDFLKSHSVPERVETLQRYFKEPIQAYGVDYPAYKVWIKEFVARLKKGWTLADALAFADIMVKDPHLEASGVGFHLVGAFVEEAEKDFLSHPKKWLETVCDNWGSVDGLCSAVLSPLLKRHPGLAGELKGWTASPNQWVRRGSAVAFVPLMKEDRLRKTAYEIATRLLDDGEDLTHKAVGWMLREAGKVDRDELEAYLLKMGPRLPRTTLRYAIEKFPKEDRKRLMEATKG